MEIPSDENFFGSAMPTMPVPPSDEEFFGKAMPKPTQTFTVAEPGVPAPDASQHQALVGGLVQSFRQQQPDIRQNPGVDFLRKMYTEPRGRGDDRPSVTGFEEAVKNYEQQTGKPVNRESILKDIDAAMTASRFNEMVQADKAKGDSPLRGENIVRKVPFVGYFQDLLRQSDAKAAAERVQKGEASNADLYALAKQVSRGMKEEDRGPGRRGYEFASGLATMVGEWYLSGGGPLAAQAAGGAAKSQIGQAAVQGLLRTAGPGGGVAISGLTAAQMTPQTGIDESGILTTTPGRGLADAVSRAALAKLAENIMFSAAGGAPGLNPTGGLKGAAEGTAKMTGVMQADEQAKIATGIGPHESTIARAVQGDEKAMTDLAIMLLVTGGVEGMTNATRAGQKRQQEMVAQGLKPDAPAVKQAVEEAIAPFINKDVEIGGKRLSELLGENQPPAGRTSLEKTLDRPLPVNEQKAGAAWLEDLLGRSEPVRTNPEVRTQPKPIPPKVVDKELDASPLGQKPIVLHKGQISVRENMHKWLTDPTGEHAQAYPERAIVQPRPPADAPAPPPKGAEKAGPEFQKAWDIVTRLWPEPVGEIKRVEVRPDIKKAGLSENGTLYIAEGSQITPAALWHEFVHAEQKQQGRYVPQKQRTVEQHAEMERETHARQGQMQRSGIFEQMGWGKVAEKGPDIAGMKDFLEALGMKAGKMKPADIAAEAKRLGFDRLQDPKEFKPVAPPKDLYPDNPVESAVSIADANAALKAGVVIGRGGNANVYEIPGTEYVLRVLKNRTAKEITKLEPVEDGLKDVSVGQAVLEGDGVQVLRRQRGETAGLSSSDTKYTKDTTPEGQSKNDSAYERATKMAADMPQSAYDQWAAELATVAKRGYNFDPSKSNNLLIDSEAGRFNMVDVNKSKTPYKAGLSDMLVVLMGNTYGYKYKGRNLEAERQAIYRKSLEAAQKAGLPLELGSSGKYSLELAGIDPNAPVDTKLTPVQQREDAVLKDRQAGLSLRKLAEKYDISHEQVRKDERAALARQGEEKSIATQNKQAAQAVLREEAPINKLRGETDIGEIGGKRDRDPARDAEDAAQDAMVAALEKGDKKALRKLIEEQGLDPEDFDFKELGEMTNDVLAERQGKRPSGLRKKQAAGQPGAREAAEAAPGDVRGRQAEEGRAGEGGREAAKPAAKPKRTSGLKKPGNSLREMVKSSGGIDPKSHAFLTHYGSIKAAIEDGIPLGVFRRGGNGLDTMAEELVKGGYIRKATDAEHQTQILLDALRTREETQHKMESDDVWAQKYEQHLLKEMENDAELRQIQREAEEAGLTKRDIEEALQEGILDGKENGKPTEASFDPSEFESDRQVETDLFGTRKAVFRSKKSEQVTFDEYQRDATMRKAAEWAEENERAIVKRESPNKFWTDDGKAYSVGWAEKGYPVERMPERDMPPTIDPAVLTEPMESPSPFASQKDLKVTGIKNEVVAAERERMNQSPLIKAMRKSDVDLWRRVTEAVAVDPEAPKRVHQEAKDNPGKAMTDDEYAMLAYRKAQLMIELDKSLERESVEYNTGGDAKAASAEVARLSKEIDDFGQITKRTGTVTGRALRIRQLLVDEEFGLQRMLQRARAAKGSELTDEERSKILALQKEIERYRDLLAKIGNEAAENDGKRKLQFGQTTKIRDYEAMVNSLRKGTRSPARKALDLGSEVSNLIRTWFVGLDLPPVARQGGFFTLAHPIKSGKALAETFGAFRSEERAHAKHMDIEDRENFKNGNYDRMGVEFTGEYGTMDAKEESFRSETIGKIPVFSGLERAHVSYLNRIRADMADILLESLPKDTGGTDAEARVIGKFVNAATGRGEMGKFKGAVGLLSHVFLAPRYVLSRFQTVLGAAWHPMMSAAGYQRAARMAIMKEYGRVAIGLGAIYGILNMLADEGKVELESDPRSSDFGKVKVGNARFDPLFGVQQAVTFMSRMATNKTKSLNGGIKSLDSEKFGQDDAADVIWRFTRSKLAPIPGAVIDAKSGKDVTGQKVTTYDAVAKLAEPLSSQEIRQLAKEMDVPQTMLGSLLILFGMGAQVHTPRK